MKTRFIIGVALLLSATNLFSRKEEESYLDRPRNNVYFNFIGGDGSVISTNYERMFLLRSKSFLEGGLGIGYRFHSYGSYKPNFRVYIGYPFYGRENADTWWIPVGVSLGVVF